jgi:hypothetical protein
MTTIYEFVKEARDNYRSETIDITDGLEFQKMDGTWENIEEAIDILVRSHFWKVFRRAQQASALVGRMWPPIGSIPQSP